MGNPRPPSAVPGGTGREGCANENRRPPRMNEGGRLEQGARERTSTPNDCAGGARLGVEGFPNEFAEGFVIDEIEVPPCAFARLGGEGIEPQAERLADYVGALDGR